MARVMFAFIFFAVLVAHAAQMVERAFAQANQRGSTQANQRGSTQANQSANLGSKSAQVNSPDPLTIVFVGDSLTEGYGVRLDQAYPALVENKLRKAGHNVKVVNGGVSGSLSSSAATRVRWFLKAKPDVLVLALGGNDGLKGTPPDVIKKNLKSAIDLAQENNIRVVLAGLKMFSNFGPDYTPQFEKLYEQLAKEEKTEFIPFLLEDVALKRDLNLPDGKHPNVEGHKLVAETVTKHLDSLLAAQRHSATQASENQKNQKK